MSKKEKEIVINTCYGGFNLSYEAMMEYAKFKKIKLYGYVNSRDNFFTLELYNPKKHDSYFCIHYVTKLLKNNTSEELNKYYYKEGSRHIKRDDPCLIKVIKKIGKRANGKHASLKVVKIPSDVNWTIEEYDGQEWIAEEHRKWY